MFSHRHFSSVYQCNFQKLLDNVKKYRFEHSKMLVLINLLSALHPAYGFRQTAKIGSEWDKSGHLNEYANIMEKIYFA